MRQIPAGTTPPVGFAGLFKIINRVLSLIFDNTSSAEKAIHFVRGVALVLVLPPKI